MTASDNILKIADTHLDVLVLVQGERTTGETFWAYVAIPPSRYEAFRAAERKGNYKLNDYGCVLEHGTGIEPPAALRDELSQKYELAENFEAKLRALALGQF